MCEKKKRNSKRVRIKSFRWGILLGSLSVFISVLGAAVTFPFLQSQRDKLNCDTLCYGTMQSMRSGLSLFGTVIISRLSDKIGRSRVLWLGVTASCCSYLILLSSTSSLTSMWISLIPSSFNQNYNVFKALFADYSLELPETERTSAMGWLGMTIGLAFMLGPALGTSLLSNYTQATWVALVLTALSGVLLLFLPTPPVTKNKNQVRNTESSSTDIKSRVRAMFAFIFVPAAQLPGSKLLLFMRALMALAFHVFLTVWTVSLKDRFNFGPKDHSYYMAWVGLCYALSQGVFAKMAIKYTGEDTTALICGCCLLLSVGRVMAMLTTSLVAMYAIMAPVIVALGIINTALTGASAKLAAQDEVGGLFGILEAVESLSGFIGPALGGILYSANKSLPLITVVGLYWIVFISVYIYFRKTIVGYRRDDVDDVTSATMNVDDVTSATMNQVKLKTS
jgi:DHA1 family tetracycline resistance protein-like MFS transporter